MNVLVIDVGNTSTHFGLFAGPKLVREWRITSAKLRRLGKLPAAGEVVVASVVPRLSRLIKKRFPAALFVNHKTVGLTVRTKAPAEVGADRLVDALAAYRLYGGPAIIVDFGTATTFDVINARGDYLGGAIAPGLLLARDTLHERTAQLPKISLRAPASVIGRDTVAAMRSGLVLGYAALVEGMVERIKSKVQGPKSKIKVIATGGLAKLICKETRVIDIIDDKLTLKGLRLVAAQ